MQSVFISYKRIRDVVLCFGIVFLVYCSAAFAQELKLEEQKLEEIDWSDPDVIAHMDPDVICPFTAEIYPHEFSLDDVVFLKLQFENTLDRDAYALADERSFFIFSANFVNLTLETNKGELFPNMRDELGEGVFSPRPLAFWRKLAPGEKGRVLYLKFDLYFPPWLPERLAAGKEVPCYFHVAVNRIIKPKYSVHARSNLVMLKPRSQEEQEARPNFSAEASKLDGLPNRYYMEKSAEFRESLGQYLKDYPSEANRIRALFALFESRNVHLLDVSPTKRTVDSYPNVDRLKRGIDLIEDNDICEGLKSFFRGKYMYYRTGNIKEDAFLDYFGTTFGYNPKLVKVRQE